MSVPDSHHPNPEDRPSATRYVVLAFLCLAAAIAYIQRNCIGVAESTIREELGLTKDQMGWVIGGFFATYAIFQIPSGWLSERWGPRKTLPLYSVVWSAATAVTALATTGLVVAVLARWVLYFQPGMKLAAASLLAAAVWLCAARLLGGASQAGIFPCSAIVIARWYPQTGRAAVSGWIGAFQQVGAIAASGLTGLLLLVMSWQQMFVVVAIPGLLWAWLFYTWFRNRPGDHAAVNHAELAVIRGTVGPGRLLSRPSNGFGPPERPVAAPSEQPAETDESPQATPWLLLLTSPAMWWICGQQFCRAAGYIFYASWFPTFLQETRGITVVKSGLLTMLPLIAAGVGAASSGTLSDWVLQRTGRLSAARRNMAVTGMLGCAGLIFTAYFIQDANAVVLVISGGAFFASLAGPIGYATTIDMGGKNVATVFATMNTSGNIGAAVFPIIVPLLQRLPGGWNLVLFVFGGVYLVAAVFWLLLNPNGTFADQSLLKSRVNREG